MTPEETRRTNEQEVADKIDALLDHEAIFCLKALMLAGHVTPHAMRSVIALSSTVRREA